MVIFNDTFWSFFSGLGSNLNGVGKIGCLEVATMVIRAMILGSAACSNKYLCFDRSIYKLGHHPSPQSFWMFLALTWLLVQGSMMQLMPGGASSVRKGIEQKHLTYVNMQIINLCYKILYGLYDVYKSTFWRKHTTCTYSSYIIGCYFTLPCLLKYLLAQS